MELLLIHFTLLVQVFLCSAVVLPSVLQLANLELTPPLSVSPPALNFTEPNQTWLPTLHCDKGPNDVFYTKLTDADCERLIFNLRTDPREYISPTHTPTLFTYLTCTVKVQGGAGRAPFPNRIDSIGFIADDIFRRCAMTRYGGTGIDFKTSRHVELYSPRSSRNPVADA